MEKNFPEIIFEEFLENNPLYKTQIPNKKFKLSSVLSNNILGSNSNERGFAYTPQKIIDSITNYTRDNGISYYTNPIEIEAKLAEIDACTKFKKAMPEVSNKPEYIVKEKFTYIKILNYNNVAEAFLKQLGKNKPRMFGAYFNYLFISFSPFDFISSSNFSINSSIVISPI